MASPQTERARANAILRVEQGRNEVGQLEERIADIQGKVALLNKRLRRLEDSRDLALMRLAKANDMVADLNTQAATEEAASGSAN